MGTRRFAHPPPARGEVQPIFQNLGFSELLTVLVVALVIFGPKKLPELGRSLGSAMRELKKAASDLNTEVTRITSEEVADARRAAAADVPRSPEPAHRSPAAPPQTPDTVRNQTPDQAAEQAPASAVAAAPEGAATDTPAAHGETSARGEKSGSLQ